jgi:hypothetical protein
MNLSESATYNSVDSVPVTATLLYVTVSYYIILYYIILYYIILCYIILYSTPSCVIRFIVRPRVTATHVYVAVLYHMLSHHHMI